MSKGKGQKTWQVIKMNYIFIIYFSIAEKKDAGKNKSLRKNTSTVEEKLSNAGSLFIFFLKISSRNSGNTERKMVK